MLSLIWLIGKWATKIAVWMTEQNTGRKTTNKGTKKGCIKIQYVKNATESYEGSINKKSKITMQTYIWLLFSVFSQSMSEYIFPMKSKINYNTMR